MSNKNWPGWMMFQSWLCGAVVVAMVLVALILLCALTKGKVC